MTPVTIELDEYQYDCSDGCCTNFGTIIKVNSRELDCRNTDVGTIVKSILTELGYDANVLMMYNGEEQCII